MCRRPTIEASCAVTQVAYARGHLVGIYAFDEAVDDNKAKAAAIVQRLRWHGHPDKDIARPRIGLLDGSGEGEDFGYGDPASLEGFDKPSDHRFKIGKRSLDHDMPDDEA